MYDMKWTIYRTGLFKKIVMHVKELCSVVTLEYCRAALVIKAFAAFNQSYTDIYIPHEFFARVDSVADGSPSPMGRVTIDITHLYRALKSCACTDAIELVIVDELSITFVRKWRRQTFVIQCHPNDRQCSLLPLDHNTVATLSSDSFYTALLQLQEIVHTVNLELVELVELVTATDPASDDATDTMCIRGTSDTVEVQCVVPARIICCRGPVGERGASYKLGTFDLHTLLSIVHFCTMSLNGEVQLSCSPDLPLKLFYTFPGNGHATVMLGHSRNHHRERL